MPDFFAIVHDGLPSLKALLMSPAEHATRETPQIDYCKCNTADYNAKKRAFFALGATGNQKLNIMQHHPIMTTKEPRMSEQEESYKA